MRRRIDEEGKADPMQADQILAKGKGPAGQSRVAHGMKTLVGAVQKEQQSGKAQQQGGKKLHRRETQCRERPTNESKQSAPPARETSHPGANPCEKIHRAVTPSWRRIRKR